MDHESIERIRTATFSVGRRGYEKREVDRFLSRLADWLESGGGDESRSEAIRSELTRIGEQTGKILSEAHSVAEQMRQDAEHHDTTVRSEADAYAERVRIEADEYAKEQRGEADSYLGRVRTDAVSEGAAMREQAEREAEEVAAEAARRRRELQTEIAQLEERRDEVLDDMRRLSSQLVGTASEHRPVPASVDEFEESADDELTEMVEIADDEPYEDDEADFEELEDDLEDDAVAEAGGETVEWDVESELEDSDEPEQGEDPDQSDEAGEEDSGR